MEKLLNILNNIRPDLDFTLKNRLIDEGILDSFDIVTLVGELNNRYEINIGVEHLLPEYFNSVGAMIDLIQKLQNEKA